ncbi:MAG: PKD domain-containing protein [Crocinitomicaceae bacterium]|nr:PKD domain-containing protein [Crocinitomicaceae bacterium]
MTKFITTVATLFTLTLTFAQDSASVLFIGNSYIYTNDLPSLFNDLTTSLGDIVTYDSQALGGATFSTHAGNTATYSKIKSQPWDYVVLQAQSQEPSFPVSQVDTETLPYAQQMADSVYANRFCSDVLMFMTWGRENGDSQWEPISTFDGMNARLRSAYMRMADSVQGSVSPVGSAWKYVRDNNPAIGLYTDGSHPSIAGSYLAACTFYAAVFRKSPIGATFTSTLDPVTAGILQNAASITVLDSLDQWNLRPLSEHTQAGFTYTNNGGTVTFNNGSTKAQTYIWNFGDTQGSTDENPSNTYANTGTFTVALIAESPCDSDTIEYEITIDQVGLIENASADDLLANLGGGIYQISDATQVKEIVVYDTFGRTVDAEVLYGNELTIDISNSAAGTYLIKLHFKSEVKTIRVLR